MTKKILRLVFLVLMSAVLAKAQTGEVSVALNEQFFDALLDAIFKNFNAPEFPLAKNGSEFKVQDSEFVIRRAELSASFQTTGLAVQNDVQFKTLDAESEILNFKPAVCNEAIRLLREAGGVKTAVRFRDGKIYAPIAFSGSYNPPFVGCIDFQGWAETNIDLEYDRQNRKLVGRLRVLSVNLGGAANLASSVLSRLVQSSIDKKINPVEILQIDKLSFVVPVQNAGGSLKMKASGVRHEINNGVFNIYIAYEFLK
jgi:hypothetical protein